MRLLPPSTFQDSPSAPQQDWTEDTKQSYEEEEHKCDSEEGKRKKRRKNRNRGDLTRNGAVNPWTLPLSDQYQPGFFPQYQYSQQVLYPDHTLYRHQPVYQPTYYLQDLLQPQQQQLQQQQQYSGQPVQGAGEQQQQQQQEQLALGPEQQSQQQAQEGVSGGQCWECSAAFQDVALLRDHLALFHPHVHLFCCNLCPHVFPSHTQLAQHYSTCHLVGEPVRSPESTQQHTSADSKAAAEAAGSLKAKKAPTRKRAKARHSSDNKDFPREGQQSGLWCVLCRINQFSSQGEFEAHHLCHVRERSLRVRLKHLTTYQLRKAKVKVESRKKNSSLKLKLKISKVGRGRGRKRREVKILSEEGMSDTPNSFQDQEGLEAEPREELEGREEGGAAAAAAAAAAEWEESGGDSEEQEASRSSADPQDTEERLEQDSLPGHDDLGTGREQDGQQEDHHYQQQDEDYQQQEQEYQQEEQEYQQQEQEYQQEEQEYQQDLPEQQEQDKEEEGYQEAPEGGEQSDGSNSGFNPEFGEQELPYGGEESGENQQNYQPQFESYPTANWFTDYESGPRIAAAMAGATATENASDGGAWAGGAEGAANPSYSGASSPPEKGSSGEPVNGGPSEDDREDGLFSQAVLGQESPEKSDRQGSFEQLCLNDSFSGQAEGEGDDDSQQQQQDQLASPQEQQQQGPGVANDLLSELEYLNNSGQSQGGTADLQPGSQPGSQSGSQSGQIDGSPHSGGPSPHSGGPSPHSAGPGTPSHLSSRGSNSGTPTSSGGHPTPPPSDTSFRALATSPITSPTQQPTSPSLHKGPTPPVTSPHQQMQHSPQQAGEQQQQQQQQGGSVPRLTIANNLMASTTSSISTHLLASTTTTSQAGVGSMMGRYGTQWSQAAGYTGAPGYPGLPGTTIASTNMPGPLRAPMPPSVGMQYRPSPPPRVRGRPPLIGHVGRPPLHQAAHLQPTRGPGRPPASSILPPPLMPAPGGRGGMMPPLQRMHQPMYPGQRAPAPQQQSAAGKRQMLGAAGHSPSKTARREDINVPSRQKDNECQIIAVANRSDGLPVISNVQGGSAAPGTQRGTVPATTESTINLSDSITLSVRASATGKDGSGRGERGGPEAGAVANLLASRGITVTPAAGERQDGGSGRDDRRLPTAQELNLSSAISVHPPTQREREGSGRERDRDGFAVPQAPPTRSSVSNSSVERPPRPPTVDLTQDVPSSGAQATRHKCHQCDRSFPTASLLADHSRVHQQQQQSRMPFKCHLCTAGFSTQKGQQHHYQQFHQLQLSAGDVAIPLVDLRSPVNVQRMAALGIRSFLPLTNLQNRGAGGVVGVPILTLENLRNGHMTLQQWGVSDVLSLGPAKTLNMPR